MGDHGSGRQWSGREGSILDFILRLVALIGTLSSAIVMGTTKEGIPFLSHFIHFHALFTDLPTLKFFVIANGVVSVYLVFSLCVAMLRIMRSNGCDDNRQMVDRLRMLLLLFDTLMLVLLTSGVSAATAIVYLAHKGNITTAWVPICDEFASFCGRILSSLFGSYGTMVIFVFTIFLSSAPFFSHH
ncbi:Casparian strip membrane protein 1 [Zostera marina]|uniref:CASP-like protein n=1 Tax=Zostera marina TaxID=29655 RepID=A0A0K9NL33_ZOSMR|nr:Casparian strip membrane protein 1 [Zostera marina]